MSASRASCIPFTAACWYCSSVIAAPPLSELDEPPASGELDEHARSARGSTAMDRSCCMTNLGGSERAHEGEERVVVFGGESLEDGDRLGGLGALSVVEEDGFLDGQSASVVEEGLVEAQPD